MTQNLNNLEKKRTLQPKNDVVFKALFGRGKEKITKALLEDILKLKIDSLELDKSQELVNDNVANKNGRLDIRAVINGNVECDIEVQLLTHEKMLERFLYYWAKIYSANLKIGEEYHKLRKTISIIIVDSEIEEFKEILKSHTKWQIREEEYSKKILTPYFQIDILEMPKAIKEYQTNQKDEVLQWMMFLDNPENMEVARIMEENENIKEAKEELDQISQDEILWRMALRADLERMDRNQMLYEANRDGRRAGMEAGKEEGKKEGKLEVAKRMLEKGMDIETIIEITGLAKEEILNGN